MTDILWLFLLGALGIYEIIPGFFAGLLAAVIVTLVTKKPGKEVEELFDKAEFISVPYAPKDDGADIGVSKIFPHICNPFW